MNITLKKNGKEHVKAEEVHMSDLYHPLNHVGYERFRNWID